MGKKLEKEQMIAAVRAMQTHFIPLKGKIVRLGLAQTNPHRDICTVDLKWLIVERYDDIWCDWLLKYIKIFNGDNIMKFTIDTHTHSQWTCV